MNKFETTNCEEKHFFFFFLNNTVKIYSKNTPLKGRSRHRGSRDRDFPQRYLMTRTQKNIIPILLAIKNYMKEVFNV